MIFELATRADFLVEMAWKSAAIAGVALLALTLLRSRSASDRAAVVRLAVVLLLALPIISLALPALQIERPVAAIETAKVSTTPTPPPAAEAPVIVPADPAADVARPSYTAPVTAVPSPAKTRLPTGLMLTIAYVAGVLLLVLRLCAGLWTLRRWTVAAEPLRSQAWRESLRRIRARAGIDTPVALLASADVASPLSWGLRAPVILIDYDTLEREEDADAVLAHEMAHIVRRDWAMLMLSRLAVALFWFNPLVWLLERALVQQAEEAADLRALGGVEPISYARTLVACGSHAGGHLVPANSIAGQGLARRVRAVLDEKRRGTPSGSGWTGLAMLLCIAISAPIAAIELVSPRAPKPPTAPAAPRAPAAPVSPAAPVAPRAPAAPVAWTDDQDVAGAVEQVIEASELSEEQIAAIEAAAEAAADAATDRAEAIAEAEVAQVEAAQARIEADQALVEADQARIEARAVAFEVARAVASASTAVSARAVGRAQPGSLTVDDLIALKVHGVDARYLTELAALAPRIRLSAKEIVATKIHGLTPARLREFAEAGYAATNIDDFVAMRVHGVTPGFIREMSAAGYPRLSADDLVAMRIHGVTADGARRAATTGRRPSPEELVDMKLSGKI